MKNIISDKLIFLLALMLFFIIDAEKNLLNSHPRKDIPDRTKIVAVIPVDFMPTYFKDTKTGNASGFAVDILNELSHRAGFKVEYIYGKPWDEMTQMVLTGKADLIPCLSESPERKKLLSFTEPIEILPVNLVVTSGSKINEIKPGILIGTIKGSLTETYLKKNPALKFESFNDLSNLLFQLLAGQIDAAFTLSPNIIKLAREAGVEDKIRIINPPVWEARRGIALRKDDTVLMNRLNPVINEFIGSPEYEKIYTRWYGKPVPYWTAERIIILSSVILFLTVFIMTLWRYQSVKKLNRELADKFEKIKKAEERIREQSSELQAANEELESANEELIASNEEFESMNEELQKSFQTIEENEIKLESYYKNAPQAIFIINNDGKYIDVNPAACNLCGYTREELLAKSFQEILSPESVNTALSCFDNLKKTGFAVSEITYQKKDDTKVFVLQNSSALPDGKYILYSLNITRRKIAEEEKFKLEEQLRQSQKMEALGLLAGGVAHDFNNILQAISGFASLLKYDNSKDDINDYADEILKSANRAADLTKNLLTFSRKQKMEMKYVDIIKVIIEIKKFITRIIGEDIIFEIHLKTDALIVNADPGHIQQSIINLITNARDAMKKGGKLTLTVEKIKTDENDLIKNKDIDKPGIYSCISITDTGTGISKENLEHIFDPFFTTKSKEKGTGLGLAIVYGIIKQHGGYISVNSRENIGTTFKIYLPVAEAEETVDMPSRNEIAAGGNESILLVEDDIAVQTVFMQTLKQAGYKVLVSNNGREALDIIKSDITVNIVILDMIMPDMNGYETLYEIRKILPELKALFVSGYTSDILDEKGFINQEIPLLIKPVPSDILLKKVRQILDT